MIFREVEEDQENQKCKSSKKFFAKEHKLKQSENQKCISSKKYFAKENIIKQSENQKCISSKKNYTREEKLKKSDDFEDLSNIGKRRILTSNLRKSDRNDVTFEIKDLDDFSSFRILEIKKQFKMKGYEYKTI